MSKEETHVIMNLDKYAAYMRKKAATYFSDDYDDDLDEFVTIPQVRQMIAHRSSGMDDKDRYLLSETGCDELFEDLKTRLYNCGLSKLAAKGLLECAWDEENEEMVFWTRGQTT
jgi:hypothetical protein